MLGKEVAYVDARYTSKKCSCCKTIQKESRKKSKYHCNQCSFQLHADWNAAINIRDNYILSSTSKTSEEQAAVIPAACDDWKQSVTSLLPCAVGS